MKKEPLILVGAGGHCKSVIDVTEHLDNFVVAGIIGMPEEAGTSILGYPVIGTDADLDKIALSYRYFHIALGFIGSPAKRIAIWERLLGLGVEIPVLISPLAYVSKYARIGAGTVVMHQAVVNASAEVGKNVIINTKALIEHDAVVGDQSHIATGAIINGGVKIGYGSFVGSGAVTRQGVIVPDNSFIKANSTVK